MPWRRRGGVRLGRLAALPAARRAEALRRLDADPGGPRTLVDLRAELLAALPDRPEMAPLDADLRRHLAARFAPATLSLERLTWESSADVLERLMRYEAVHPLQGWDDLRLRVAPDRRCYAFFHAALPRDPLIFVEVALTRGIPGAIAPLIDPGRTPLDPDRANTGVFYSISSCQRGLRGIALGGPLIERVVAAMAEEGLRLSTHATLSPMPGLAAALRRGDVPADVVRRLAGPAAASIYAGGTPPDRELRLVGLAYLLRAGRPGQSQALDPVAHFHLSNGARLERVNARADTGPTGVASLGLMVNYRYDGSTKERNRHAYLAGEVPVAPSLRRLANRVAAAWPRPDP